MAAPGPDVSTKPPSTADRLHNLNLERELRVVDVGFTLMSDWTMPGAAERDDSVQAFTDVHTRTVRYTSRTAGAVTTDVLVLSSGRVAIGLHPECTVLLEVALQIWQGGELGMLSFDHLRRPDRGLQPASWDLSAPPPGEEVFFLSTEGHGHHWSFSQAVRSGPVIVRLHETADGHHRLLLHRSLGHSFLDRVQVCAHRLNRQYLTVTLPQLLTPDAP